MRADVPPFDVMRHTFWFGSGAVPSDPGMRRIAGCIAEIRPVVERLSRAHGDRSVMWALTAIIVDAAIDAGDGAVVAALFRTNARLLELETDADLLGLHGPRDAGDPAHG